MTSDYGFLALVVFLTFGVRFVLAGWNSYWLDELYSVEIYAIHHENVIDAVRHLAETSIHPPMYQSLLYFWVQFFGDGEIATRTLSNVAMTLGVIFTHRFADRAFGRFVANTSSLMLALTYLVMYYGLETRSYGISLMFSTLSTLAFFAYIDSGRRKGEELRHSRIWPWGVVLIAANLGLMFTHYYNFFFWAAQVLFLAVYSIAGIKKGSRLRSFSTAFALYFVQLAVFAAVWGRVTLNAYQSNTGRFSTEDVTFTPFQILDSVTVRSLNFGPLGLWALALVAVVVAVVVIKSWTERHLPKVRRKLFGVAYLSTMTLIPPVIAYSAFQIAGFERLNARYVMYLLPGIVVLISLAASEVLRELARSWNRRRGISKSRFSSYSTVCSIALVLVLVGPGAVRASRSVKDDWRGMAREVVAIVESDPGSDYLILEPAFRTTPVFDYYLRRYSKDLRVTATIRRSEEERGKYAFERLEDQIEMSDFVIVPFVHHRTTNFPIALQILRERYDIEHWQIDDDNKGFVIFAVHPGDGSASR